MIWNQLSRRLGATGTQLLFLSLLLGAAPTWASDSTAADPEVNLGGVAWAKATYNAADDAMRLPDLDLYRVHLWGSSQLGPNWSGTFRLHAGTAPGVLSRYNQDGTIFVYQAFLDRKHLFSDSDKVTLGLATNAYLKRLYRLHGTRFISRLLSQRIGYLTPTPLGVRYEFTTASLQSAITLETTAVRPDTPTTHLVGAGSTLHWNPAPPWTLSAHATYRHRSNTSAAAPSEAVFASAITYQNTHLTLSAEVVGRLLTESTTDTELGGGLLTKLKLYRSLHLFGQLIAGNQAFQDALGPRFTWRTGPLLLLEDNLMVALIVDVEHRDAPTVITSLAASKQF